MSGTLSILRREIQAYFVSPIAYTLIVGFLIVTGAGFLQSVTSYALLPPVYLEEQGLNLRSFLVPGGIVTWANLAALLCLPALSMRLFSEERKVGTIELLLTSPVTTPQLVLGKYLAALSVFGATLVLTFPYLAVLAWKGEPEWMALGAAYAGLLLYGGVLLAIGTFASSLTENQIVALVMTYALLMPFLMIDQVALLAGPPLDSILAGLGIGVGLSSHFALGLVDTHYLVLYLGLTFIFLFLCSQVIDSTRWR